MAQYFQMTSPELGQDIDRNSTDPGSGLCDYEEYCTLWPIGYKELLNWNNDIQWLFSPVTGKYPYPGDLWGIDPSGNLIIAETKLCKTSYTQDPFIDFVGYETKVRVQGLRIFSRQILQDRWQTKFNEELRFIERYSTSLEDGIILDGSKKYPGIVPYSIKRFAVRRWQYFYLNVVVPSIKGDYETLVRQYLQVREENPGATQHYFGVLSASSIAEARLSKKGTENYELLCTENSRERVHLCKIQATYLDGAVQLTSQVM